MVLKSKFETQRTSEERARNMITGARRTLISLNKVMQKYEAVFRVDIMEFLLV